MPYKTVGDLPDAVKGLPAHGQDIYLAAYNAAWEQYKDRGDRREALAHATAWAQVGKSYEQQDGNWVAKEAKVTVNVSGQIISEDRLGQTVRTAISIESLRKVHADIIQEIGKRNANADEKRIKGILSMCLELLNDQEAADEVKVKLGLKEAESVLTWLREQAAMKTEDGVKFPAEAFAYAPSDNVSEWKLRIWEDLDKKVTRTQLGRAAAALSPGGFRGQKAEIPREDLSAVKRKIRGEYRKLDVADEEIPRWVKEAEARALLAEMVPLAEAVVTGQGIAKVVVIRPGFNSSKDRYYPADVLARDHAVFEGIKMYADHPTSDEEKQRPERSIKDWVATLKNVHVDDKGQIIGEAIIVEPWMQAKLAALRDKGMLQELGISINAVGSASKGEITGVKTNVIERLIKARSVDFVTEPGAGGAVQMYETSGPENDVDLVSLETLRERRPDLVKAIEGEVKAAIQVQETKRMQTEEQIKGLEKQVVDLTTERDTLKTQLTESDKAKRVAEAKSAIDVAIGKSQLPEPSKVRLVERFKGVEKADGLTEAIKAEGDYVAALTESGKVKGMGGHQPDTATSKAALKESIKRYHPEWTDAQVETAATGR